MELLDSVASICDRKVGSAASQKAREHIVEHLKRRVPEGRLSFEEFPVDVLTRFRASVETLNNAGLPVHLNVHVYDNTGVAGQSITSEIFEAGLFLYPWERKKVRGKIVVYQHSNIVHRMLQVKRALEVGAVAVVLVGYSDEFIPKGLGYPVGIGECPIVAVGITHSEWGMLQRDGIQGRRMTIRYQCEHERLKGTNVVVDLKGSDAAAGTLVIGAHYDSWYEGWLDNGVAVQMLADLMELLAKRGSRHSIRGIFFDGEEVGLLGARHHVTHNDLSHYKFYLNLEMPIPSKGGRLKLLPLALGGQLRKVIDRWLLIKKGFIPLPLSWFYRILGGFPADIHHFYVRQIPCLTTFCSHPYYHTPLDNRDNLRLDLYHEVKEQMLHIINRVDRVVMGGCERIFWGFYIRRHEPH